MTDIKVLTLDEVAELGRCHPHTVRRAIKRGELTAFRRTGARGKLLILAEDAIKWALGGADSAPSHIGVIKDGKEI